MMNSYYGLIFFVSTIFVFAGCRSSRELVYLENLGDDELIGILTDDKPEYTISPGDLLYVSIKSMNPEVNALFNPEEGIQQGYSSYYQKFTTPAGAYLYGFEIDATGTLNLPILGRIPVAGLRHSELGPVVQHHADKYLRDATVKVKLLNYKVTVLGEVRSPGIYYNYSNDFTVLQALAMANGNTDYASIKKVMVCRPGKDGLQTYHLDLSTKESLFSPAFYLYPDDYVFVEPDKHKNIALNSTAISLLVSSVSVTIAIFGLILK